MPLNRRRRRRANPDRGKYKHYEATYVYCAVCSQQLIPCPCGSTRYYVRVHARKVRTAEQRNLAQKQIRLPKLSWRFPGDPPTSLWYEPGILVDRRDPDARAVQRLRAMGLVKRKARRSTQWREYWEKRWARHDRYFSSPEGMAQSTELRLLHLKK